MIDIVWRWPAIDAIRHVFFLSSNVQHRLLVDLFHIARPVSVTCKPPVNGHPNAANPDDIPLASLESFPLIRNERSPSFTLDLWVRGAFETSFSSISGEGISEKIPNVFLMLKNLSVRGFEDEIGELLADEFRDG
jgi:hypothetical protein